MIRILLVILLAVAGEYWAFQLYRTHPLVWPAHLQTLMLLVQMAMCWSGVESARWLLRKSPVARMPGVESDWVRLWLWVGPSGGLLLCLACFLGKWAYSVSDSQLAGPLLVANISGGAVCWLIGGFWAVPEAFSDKGMTNRERILALTGLLFHSLGFWIFATVYPANTLPHETSPLILLLSSALFFFFLLFYLAVSCAVWSVPLCFCSASVGEDPCFNRPCPPRRCLEPTSGEVDPRYPHPRRPLPSGEGDPPAQSQP